LTKTLNAKSQVGHLFTHDEGVINATAELAGWLAIVVVGDGLNATFSGAFTAQSADPQECGASPKAENGESFCHGLAGYHHHEGRAPTPPSHAQSAGVRV